MFPPAFMLVSSLARLLGFATGSAATVDLKGLDRIPDYKARL